MAALGVESEGTGVSAREQGVTAKIIWPILRGLLPLYPLNMSKGKLRIYLMYLLSYQTLWIIHTLL